MTDDRIFVRDCVKVGFCVREGVIPKCKTHGIDIKRFIREGYPISEVEHIDDEHFRQAIAEARRRIGAG